MKRLNRFLIPVVILLCLGVGLLFIISQSRQEPAIQLLQNAIAKDDASEVEILLKRHPELKEKRFKKGATFLHLVAEQGNVPMLNALFSGGFDLEVRDETKRTPLFVATVSAKHSAVSELLKLGAAVDAANVIGSTPLQVAASRGDITSLELLLRFGADVNLANTGGMTALHSATYAGHLEAVKLLIESGARINAPDIKGDKPYDYAKSSNHPEIAIFLKEKMKN